MTLVELSAASGAGGRRIGPALAEWLGVPFLGCATEGILLRQADSGHGVILGRGGVVVLGDDDRVLRVRLHGPQDRRIRQAMGVRGVDEETAIDTRSGSTPASI